jgi:Tol biopolymer transport system component/DNA-binding winged helix-turn-helix (wHTH) protein
VHDQKSDRLYAFGLFVLDPVRRSLRRSGEAVPLRPKTFDVLLAFVEHRGELLDKDQLFKLIWKDSIVEENNLARHVSTLRRVFRGHTAGEEYIVTVPLRGYRFVAPVEIHEGGTASPSIESAIRVPTDVAAPIVMSPDNPAANRRSLTATWVGLVTLLVVAASFTGTDARLPRAGERNGMPHRKLWQLTFNPGVQDEPAWSPGGEWIAYSSDRNGNADIWVQPVGQENPRRVTSSPDNDWQPAWSPDARYIAFRSERGGGGLFVVHPDGAGERKIADFGYKPQWSPDTSKILFYGTLKTSAARWSEIYQVDLDGGSPSPVLRALVSQYQWFYAAWHPSGARISIYGARRGGATEMITASIDGASVVKSEITADVVTRLRDANVALSEFAWSPLGDALFFEGTSEGVRNIWRIGVDSRTLAWTPAVQRLTTGAELQTNIDLSRDGKRIAFSQRRENTRLWSFPFDSQAGRITGPGEPFTSEGADAPYDISPDGRRLIYRVVRHGKQELWQRTLANGQDRLLLSAASIAAPRVSRDGRRLVYRRDDGSGANLHVVAMLTLATGVERVLTSPRSMSGAEIMAPFDWSADGTTVLGSCSGDKPGMAICLFSTSGAAPSAPQVFASRPNYGLFEAQFSPDGRWVTFNGVHEGGSAIYAVPVQGGDWVPIAQGGFWDDKPRWAPDGRAIYFTSVRRGFVNVRARRFDPERGEGVGETFEVTNFETPARVVLPRIKQLHTALTANRIILPMTDVSASLWVLDNVHE